MSWNVSNVQNMKDMFDRSGMSYHLYIEFTNETLYEAVTSYVYNRTAAIQQYGVIEKWNVSNVTDMSNILKYFW